MNFILIVYIYATIVVVAHIGSKAETKRLTSLLAKIYASCNIFRAITLCECIRISICLNSTAKSLSGTERCILNVISINIVCFCTRRRFTYRCKTIPGNTAMERSFYTCFIITKGDVNHCIFFYIKNTMVDTSFILFVASLVPQNFCHVKNISLSKYRFEICHDSYPLF